MDDEILSDEGQGFKTRLCSGYSTFVQAWYDITFVAIFSAACLDKFLLVTVKDA